MAHGHWVAPSLQELARVFSTSAVPSSFIILMAIPVLLLLIAIMRRSAG